MFGCCADLHCSRGISWSICAGSTGRFTIAFDLIYINKAMRDHTSTYLVHGQFNPFKLTPAPAEVWDGKGEHPGASSAAISCDDVGGGLPRMTSQACMCPNRTQHNHKKTSQSRCEGQASADSCTHCTSVCSSHFSAGSIDVKCGWCPFQIFSTARNLLLRPQRSHCRVLASS